MIKEPYFDNNDVVEWRELSNTQLNDEEFWRYGFWTISFLHVCLAKLFFLPIIIIILVGFLIISALVNFIVWKNWTSKVYYVALYGLFCNIPLRYMMEMYQDLVIAALVNIWLIGIESKSMALQFINFGLSLLFLILSFVSVILITIMILKWKFPPQLWELFASLRQARMPILFHVLFFGISRFVMGLLIAIGDKMPSTVAAFIFSFTCLLSVGI